MKYWLTTLGLISAIDDSILAPSPKSSHAKSSTTETLPLILFSYIYLKPKGIDYHYLHRIFSTLSDSLYDIYYEYNIYYEYKSAKELRTTLEEKYSLDDAGIERFTSSFFNKFMMTDSKLINNQLHEFQNYIRHL